MVKKRRNPWERVPEDDDGFYTPDVVYYITNLAKKWPKFAQNEENRFLNIHNKRAALKASPFVVSLVSYTGEIELKQGSGVIIASDDTNTSIFLTSAYLIRQPVEDYNLNRQPAEEYVAENKLAADLKVIVRLAGGKSFLGEICAHDFHFNLAAIKFMSDSAVSCAPLKRVNDSIDLNPSQCQETSFRLLPHSSSVNITPGDAVVAVGRYFAPPYEVMASPGVFSLDNCGYDCKELFYTNCSITRCGDGGPLLNLAGDVIGITFYDYHFNPFLPINLAYKWWELYQRFGESRQPFVGIGATNFYAADLEVANKMIRTFPSISKGVLVEKVISGSSADAAGLRRNDVIIQCGGKVVQSFLEFMEIICDNIGLLVELVVVRAGCFTLLHPKMMVAELTPDKLNCWPCWEEWG